MSLFFRIAAHFKYVMLWLQSKHVDIVQPCSPEHKKSDDDVAIYCIHGTGDHNSAFEFVVDNIKSTLPPEVKSIHRICFDGRFQLNDIIYFAHQLKNKILVNGHKKIILMGHSRGAIIASYFAEYLAKENNIEVETTINICGPFGGTKWAFFPFTYSASVDQMRTDSVFLENLRQQMIASTENSYHYFSGSKDLLVPPSQAYIKQHANNVIELEEDHLSIMLSEELISYIKNIIHSVIENKKLASVEPNLSYSPK